MLMVQLHAFACLTCGSSGALPAILSNMGDKSDRQSQSSCGVTSSCFLHLPTRAVSIGPEGQLLLVYPEDLAG